MPRREVNRFAAFMNSRRVAAGFLVVAGLACGIGAVFAHDTATVAA